MKTIKNIEINPPFEIICTFEDGTIKKADIKELMETPAFEPLKNTAYLMKVQNRGYYIEWPEWEIDLSADTLWHLGTTVCKTTLETAHVI